MKIKHIVNPAKYREKYFPGVFDGIFMFDPAVSPLTLLMKKLKDVPPDYVRWMEDDT